MAGENVTRALYSPNSPPRAVVQDLLTWGTAPESAVCPSSLTGRQAEWALCGCLWHVENETWNNRREAHASFLEMSRNEAETMLSQVWCEISVCRSPLSSMFSSAFSPPLPFSFFKVTSWFPVICSSVLKTIQRNSLAAEMGTQLDSLASEMGTQLNKFAHRLPLRFSLRGLFHRACYPTLGRMFPHL